MKPHYSNQRNHALTLLEVLVIIFIITILVTTIWPANNGSFRKAKRISCANNLKQIGLAEKIWAGDHTDELPLEVSITNDGTMEINDGGNAWANFLAMSNELSTPKILFCPADDEHWPSATNFSSQLAGHISYFFGLNEDGNPQTLLSGDDNFEISGVPVKPGLLELSTNTPPSWTAARHIYTGNIVLGDGSVQSLSSAGLHTYWQQTGLATNHLAIP